MGIAVYNPPSAASIGAAALDANGKVPWALLAGNVVCVTDHVFGADPSGVADSTAAIQAALDAAFAAGGGIVWAPGGIYRVLLTLVVRHGVRLLGAGLGVDVNNGVISWSGTGAPATKFQWAGGAAPVVRLAGPGAPIDFVNIGIDGGGTATKGVEADRIQGSQVRFAVTNCDPAVGIGFDGITNTTTAADNSARNDIVVFARTATLLRIDGNAAHTANWSYNHIWCAGQHGGDGSANAVGVIMGDCDSNDVWLWVNRGAGIGVGVECSGWERANNYWHVAAGAGGLHKSADLSGGGNSFCYSYNQENGQPDPAIDAGGKLPYISFGRNSRGMKPEMLRPKVFMQGRVTQGSSGTFSIDASQGNVFEVTLNGNVTGFSIINPPGGTPNDKCQEITVDFIQDATGGRTFPAAGSWTAIDFDGATTPAFTTTANHRGRLKLRFDPSTSRWKQSGAAVLNLA